MVSQNKSITYWHWISLIFEGTAEAKLHLAHSYEKAINLHGVHGPPRRTYHAYTTNVSRGGVSWYFSNHKSS